MSVIGMAYRQARSGNYKPIKFVILLWFRGLTSVKCNQEGSYE